MLISEATFVERFVHGVTIRSMLTRHYPADNLHWSPSVERFGERL